MTRQDRIEAEGLLEFIDAAPSPYHAVEQVARRLADAGFEQRSEREAWSPDSGRFFAVRGGALVAMALEPGVPPTTGLAIFGAHTDSPNLRIKPRPDLGVAGWRQLGVEIYGGVLLNSWLDRDLGLSGRCVVRTAAGLETRLFLVDRPLLRVPQLAIHLDRDIVQQGLKLDRQRHMAPVWGLGSTEEHGFRDFLAAEVGCERADLLSWDAMAHDLTPSALLGREAEMVSAPRLDNLASCYAATRAFLRALETREPLPRVPALCFFDHEEVGSGSSSGAQGTVLADLFERSVLARGGGREERFVALRDSFCVSADMAHATHPNYVDRHDPEHHIAINAGPVIKINATQRYATDAETEARFQAACEDARIPYQKFVNRSDLACGSTIGPLTAAGLGIATVDVGCPQLSMHSARELAGARDIDYLVRALAVLLAG